MSRRVGDRSFLFSSAVGSTWISNWQHGHLYRGYSKNGYSNPETDDKASSLGAFQDPETKGKGPKVHPDSKANVVPEILKATRHIWRYRWSHVKYVRRTDWPQQLFNSYSSYVISAIVSVIRELTSQLQVGHWMSLHVASGYLLIWPPRRQGSCTLRWSSIPFRFWQNSCSCAACSRRLKDTPTLQRESSALHLQRHRCCTRSLY